VNALLLLLAIHTFPQCGVRFELPRGWTAVVEPVEADDREAEQCDIGIRPPHYAKQLAETQWDAEDPPMTLTVFKVPFDEALTNAGFEKQEERGLGMEGGYGSFAAAQEYRLGKWTGWEADTFYRGFAKDGAKLDPDESRVYSGDIAHIVVKDRRHVVGVECTAGVMEHTFNCADAVAGILKSLR
jgi:hypothetical protein